MTLSTLAQPALATGEILHVPADYPTIQSAIEAASDGDEIIVEPGTYNEVINFLGKAIALRSSCGAEATTIDGSGFEDSVVRCVSGEGRDTVLQGFTVTGGDGSPGVGGVRWWTCGGGMYNVNTSPTVTHCRFVRNGATGNADRAGGGMYNVGGSPSIEYCLFEHNAASFGGGMHNAVGSPEILGCAFTENQASNGGGIKNDSSHARISDTIFSRNRANTGGGVYNLTRYKGHNVTIDRCIFQANFAYGHGGGVANTCSGDCSAITHVSTTNSLFVGN